MSYLEDITCTRTCAITCAIACTIVCAYYFPLIGYDDHFTTPKELFQEHIQFSTKNRSPNSVYRAARVKDGIDQAKKVDVGAQILVTGSLYLVEAALEIVKEESRIGLPDRKGS